MRFVRYDDGKFGVLREDDTIVELTDRLGLSTDDPLGEFLAGEFDATEYLDANADAELSDVTLTEPVTSPGKVVAAPLNYEDHIEESIEDDDIDLDDWFSIEDFGYFLKAPSSIIGPDRAIELPFTDRRFDHEIELAFVMEETVKDVDAASAWDAIFGFTILLDITVRGEQDRSSRKSYDTFTVVGPWIVTPDEISSPQDLAMELYVDDELRQSSNTSKMVYSCADIVEYASFGTTIEQGDLLTTGTPAGVGPIVDGDTIQADIEEIGAMSVDVTARDESFHDRFE